MRCEKRTHDQNNVQLISPYLECNFKVGKNQKPNDIYLEGDFLYERSLGGILFY